MEFNARILIADDDRIQVQILERYLVRGISSYCGNADLQEIRLRVRSFPDGAPLLAWFAAEYGSERRIPLCLLDLRMPSLGGMETAEALRNIDPEVFIIIITSYEDISYDEMMKSLKKDVYFMNKPVRKRELLPLVTSLLISWNNQQKLRAAYQEVSHVKRQLQTFIENTPVAVAMLDRHLTYLAYSRRWVSNLGLGKTDLRGKFHYEIMPDIPEKWKNEHLRCLAGQTIRNHDEKFPRPDAPPDYVNRELHPLKNADGEIIGIIIFIEFITEKRRAEKARAAAEEKLKENENYLKAIMAAVQTGLMIIEPETYRIMDVNPYTLQMLGYERDELVGKDFYELRNPDMCEKGSENRIVNDEYALLAKDRAGIHVRRSVKQARVNKKEYIVQSLLDISDIRNLMKKQEMNIDLAKYLLKKINGNPARYTDLSGGRSLFFHALYLPCYKEGGDHYFLRTIHLPESPDRTFVSLKDQSGHEVGCILKSIITDQAHHRILDTAASGRLADMIHLLNREMFHSGIFGQKDFFTAVTAMIDHQHLELSYVSAGHPRFFLIREGNITALPAHGKPGRNLPIPVLPEMRFSEGKCGLQTGDRLFFYTDGLTDILCPAGSSALPFDAMQSFLADMIKTDPEICISGLLSAVAEKLGKEDQDGTQCRGEHHFPDDITILGMEIEKKPEPAEKSFRPRDADDLNDTVLELYKEISAELEKRNFRTDEPAFRSVLAEGCINAWKHGNGQDSRKTIRIRWYPGNDLHLEITDEGEGFDYGKVSDPKSPENIIRSSGRGLFIIRHYSETLHWEDGGKRMVVTIKNQNNNRQGL